ncbi:hypothetical protein LJR098_002343 [Rhizobium sp. LjRoot98]|uniref:hypothetical protein n=1 Tax=unclassified Rhizobium TaxID=2613769 RepID=UPI00071299BA|nr:hypothetical protein [Rhizobium sp. Root1204]KQV33528.1 hypothetical protein ASC96_30415 [Rhizobium sp. Root1204]
MPVEEFVCLAGGRGFYADISLVREHVGGVHEDQGFVIHDKCDRYRELSNSAFSIRHKSLT